MTPSWVAAILRSKLTSLVGRLALTFAFWFSALSKLVDWNSGLGEMAHFNLNPPAAFNLATILVQLVGSALVIWGRFAWLGAGVLAVFTVMTIPIAHSFWSTTGAEQLDAIHFVQEHVSLIGGLILAAVLAQRDAAPARTESAPLTAGASAS